MQAIHDVIGIGFGPSNLALAIALQEQRHVGKPLQCLFIEKQGQFAWHPHMLLENTHMQISFLKDLATLRNPTSRFTFINYLHEKGRLPDFINLKSFFPSRHEFNDYLAWAAAQFDTQCAYGEEVVEVLPERQGNAVTLLRVRSRNQGGQLRERLTRHLVLAIGGTAAIPAGFQGLAGEPRIFHSSNYLRELPRLDRAARIAVVGAGQSAAEIVVDLHGRAHAPEVDMIMRASALRPPDDSPFVNEIFNADFTDHIYGRSGAERAALVNEFRHTNYAVADLALIEQIFQLLYAQQVSGATRLRLRRRHEIEAVRADADGIHLTLADLDGGHPRSERYDAVVLATGYRRDWHKTMLEGLRPYLGDFEVDRHYRIQSTPDFHPAVFLQGACEDSHGLSDTLLSVTAVRTGEIGGALRSAAGTPGTLHVAAARQPQAQATSA